ncbi:unnamed protein product [Meloidogyne enterolobii]|uniref:Uncharacterized protein n=1 Tax=Meloidogyne enterolobii TaxID=390850 RepID=A0ACB1A978_MELEN
MELCKDILTNEQEQQQSETNPKSLFGDPFSASNKHQNSSFDDQSYFANILNNAILDADEIKSKSKRVVIERAPDNTDIINIAKKLRLIVECQKICWKTKFIVIRVSLKML